MRAGGPAAGGSSTKSLQEAKDALPIVEDQHRHLRATAPVRFTARHFV
ncbi:MAG: hypothetical protein ACJ8F1_22815 [Polyangia bacterium]